MQLQPHSGNRGLDLVGPGGKIIRLGGEAVRAGGLQPGHILQLLFQQCCTVPLRLAFPLGQLLPGQLRKLCQTPIGFVNPAEPAVIPQQEQHAQSQAQRRRVGSRLPGHMVQEKGPRKNACEQAQAGNCLAPLPQIHKEKPFFSLQANTPLRISL